jgi:hypothetical protein
MPEPIFLKGGTYFLAPEPIRTTYFINDSHKSVCQHVYFARKRLHTNINAATDTRATIEELLDASFSMWSVSYQSRVCGSVNVSSYRCWQLGKHVPAPTRNCWRIVVLYAVLVVSKESRRLILPRTSFFFFLKYLSFFNLREIASVLHSFVQNRRYPTGALEHQGCVLILNAVFRSLVCNREHWTDSRPV